MCYKPLATFISRICARALDAPRNNLYRASLPVLLNMGKKSRRERGSNREYLRKKADEKVDAVEEADPEYNNLEKLPKGLAQLALKYRFGGAHLLRGNLRSVKICRMIALSGKRSSYYSKRSKPSSDSPWGKRTQMRTRLASFVRFVNKHKSEIPQPRKNGPPRVRPPDRRPRHKVRVQFCSSSHLDRNKKT